MIEAYILTPVSPPVLTSFDQSSQVPPTSHPTYSFDRHNPKFSDCNLGLMVTVL